MPWRVTDLSALGEAATSQIEVFPSTPERASRWRLGPNAATYWEFVAVRPLPQHATDAEEIYSREQDLIARYRQTATDTFAFQLDWQILETQGPFVSGVELWLSVQTDLLDTQPELEVTSQAPAGQDWQIWEHAALADGVEAPLATPPHRPAAMLCDRSAALPSTSQTDSLIGLWLIEPSDQCDAQICSPIGEPELSVRLFGNFMEKGVIRRARMRFLVAAASISEAQVADAYRAFAASPLPLTA